MVHLNKFSRALLLLLTVLGGALYSYADPLPDSAPIILQVGWHDPTTGHGELPRCPINPPSASLDDHTLYINSEHPAYTLYLVDTTGSRTTPFTCTAVCAWATASVAITRTGIEDAPSINTPAQMAERNF